MDYGYRLLTNDVKEVQSMADLKGMKIRTMSSTYQVQTWECLDAVPTVISFSELFTALQQHTVDGRGESLGRRSLPEVLRGAEVLNGHTPHPDAVLPAGYEPGHL